MIGGFDTMQEKEVSLCTWLHHIATVTGIYAGLYQLMTKELNRWRKGGLILFTSFQSWAGIKILRDAVTGIPRFRQVCDSIHNLTNDSGQRQRILWLLTIACIFYKCMIPCQLGSKCPVRIKRRHA